MKSAHFHPARASLALLCATLLVAACSKPDNPVEMLGDYNSRIARILDAPLPVAAATRVPTWPAMSDIVQTPTNVGIDLFASLDSARCGMLQEIGARGPGLGRLQLPSQRLLYEMRLVRGLRQCEEQTRADLGSDDPAAREFATTVQQLLEIKRRDLPLLYWNATFAAPELRDFFNVGALPLRTGDAQAVVKAANALDWLAALGRLAPGAPLPAGEAMDQQYFQLVGNKLGGRAWLSIDLATRELERSSELLENAATTGMLCPGGRAGAQAERLQKVHAELYVRRLKPWLAVVGGEAGMLAAALEDMWRSQQVTAPPALARYRESVWAPVAGSLREDFDAATRRHALAWKAALSPCGYPAIRP